MTLLSRTLRIGLLGALALLSPSMDVRAQGAQVIVPDTCISAFTPGRITLIEYPDIGNGVEVRYTAGSLAANQLAVIVNGNGWPIDGYQELAEHLATNGFITAILMRPGASNAGGNAAFVLDSVHEILDRLGIASDDPALKVALLGHSQGGRLAAAAANADVGVVAGLPIRAVVALAPGADDDSALTASATPNLLVMYGSQDEDLEGYYAAQLGEAFRLYDNADTESTTTCNSPPCAAPGPVMDKTMIYIRGGDHAGLVGYNVGPGAGVAENTQYIDGTDQLCITKAYATAFLRWKLLGISVYHNVLRGTLSPASVQSIVTSAPDAFGNAAGSPLALEFQSSPIQRKLIENFTVGLGTYTKSASVLVQHQAAGTLSGSPFFIRHMTGLALVGWSSSGWIRWQVPNGSRVGATYTHFSLRAGQLEDAPAPRDNPMGSAQAMWVGLEDGNGALSWHHITGFAPPDPYMDDPDNARSAMRTVRIPVASIQGINLNDVRYVRLLFSAGTHGTMLVDTIEWDRD